MEVTREVSRVDVDVRGWFGGTEEGIWDCGWDSCCWEEDDWSHTARAEWGTGQAEPSGVENDVGGWFGGKEDEDCWEDCCRESHAERVECGTGQAGSGEDFSESSVIVTMVVAIGEMG